MRTRHLVDPQLAAVLDALPGTALSAETLAETRARAAAAARVMLRAGDAAIAVAEHRIPAGDHDVRVRLYRAADAGGAAPAVLHFHGGGFVMGNVELGDARCRAWAAALRGVIVTVDYRLAPEHPYPAALDDAAATLCWLHERAAALGVDPARIAVSGESAGGGLAAALCLRTRDANGPAIAFQLLVYPMLDDRTGTEGDVVRNRFAGEFVWTEAANRFGWASLLGRAPGGPGVSPFAAPARATDLTGLPPAMIATAALDLFVDEDVDYAMRLIRAGVPTELYVAPGAFHGFDAIMPAALLARGFEARCLDALRRALAVER